VYIGLSVSDLSIYSSLTTTANSEFNATQNFEVLMIRQTTSQVSVENQIIISLRFNVDLKNATLTFSGLVETNTVDQILSVGHDSLNHTRDFGSTGVWTKADGSLELHLVRAEAQINYTVNFTLNNPDRGQPTPPSTFARVRSQLITLQQRYAA
jgi:hypothetical protein